MDGAVSPALKWTIAGLTTAFVGVAIWLGVVVYRNAKQPVAQQPTQTPTTVVEPHAEIPPAVSSALNQADTQSNGANQSTNASTDKGSQEQTTPLRSQKGATEGQAEATLTATMETATSADGAVDVTITANLPISISWTSRSCTPAKSGEKDNFDKTQRFTLGAADTRRCAHWTVTATSQGKQQVSFTIDLENAVATAPSPAPQPTANALSVSVSTTSTNGRTTLLATASEPVRLGIDGSPTGELAATHSRTITAGNHTVIARTADGREQRFSVSGSSSSVSSR